MAEAAASSLLDARGLRCPLPVLKTEKSLTQLPEGTTLVVLATDPIAEIDIPLYCLQHGHSCETTKENGVLRFSIRKSPLPRERSSN